MHIFSIFQPYFWIFDPYDHQSGKNELPYLIRNFPSILKILLRFFQNVIFKDLWRHNDVKVCTFFSIFQPYFWIFDPYNHQNGKNELPYLIENFPRIMKNLLRFSKNVIFMDLWRHNDVKVCKFFSIFQPYFWVFDPYNYQNGKN